MHFFMQAQASSGLTCLWCLEYSDYFEVNHFKFCLQKGILPPVCNLLLELSLLAWFYHFALSCPKWSVSCSVVSDSCDPMDCSLPGSSCPWNSPGKDTGVGCHFLLQGIEPGSPALQADEPLPSEPPGKPIVSGCSFFFFSPAQVSLVLLNLWI